MVPSWTSGTPSVDGGTHGATCQRSDSSCDNRVAPGCDVDLTWSSSNQVGPSASPAYGKERSSTVSSSWQTALYAALLPVLPWASAERSSSSAAAE